MREDLRGRNGGEKFPVNENQTPGGEGGDCGNETGSFLRLFRTSALAAASPSVGGQDRHALLLFHGRDMRARWIGRASPSRRAVRSALEAEPEARAMLNNGA